MNYSRLLLRSPNWRTSNTKDLNVWQSVKNDSSALNSGFEAEELSAMDGSWSVVEKRADEIVLATDLPRSHPLSYAFINDKWVVTDDVEQLRNEMVFRPNQAQINAFKHTAFALGDETLVEGIYSTPAATLTRLFPDGTKTSEPIIEFRYSENPIENPELFTEHFSKALDETFGRLLENAGSRELVIPLSGGLDSRLIAIWLKKLNAPNITCFTYGKPDSTESRISRQVADDLGLKWIYISMEPEEVRRAWNKHSDAFLRATWKGTSLPHVQDWFSLFQMKQNNVISQDAIFLPGHTIVGNMHDESLVEHNPTKSERLESALRHYANMQGKWQTASRLPAIQQELVSKISSFKDDGPRSRQSFFESLNVYNRQAKYINNSMSSYEYFGYSWALPMLEKEVWQTWLTGSQDLTLSRRWYKEFITKKFSEETGRTIALFSAPSTKMPELPKQILLKFMRATRANILLDRYRSAKTVVDHPMAFEAFTEVSRKQQFRRVMTGTNQLGFWTESFLNNSWGGQGKIVPEAI